MSLFNQLGEYGLNQLIARRLTTPGPAPSPTVEPALFPSIVLESDRVEWGFLKGERIVAARAVQGGAVGNLTGIQIRNPASSNTLIVIEWLEWQTTGTNLDAWLDYALGPDLATLQATSPFDTRWPAAGAVSNAIAVVSSTNGVPNPTPPGARAWGRFPGVTSSGFNRFPIILRPSSTLGFTAVTANVALVVNMIWRERTAQPGEI